ncbi:MAG: hypothetical protein HC892_02960 [Saprospiraceae bacterium]|nr:hypothetical protein [Saprospiraceae bacterium]
MIQNPVIPITYPTTKKVTHLDTYFDTKLEDNYFWLEDDRSEETASWVTAQNEVTFGYLEQIPYREAIRKRLTELWNYEKYSAPFLEGEYTYFYKMMAYRINLYFIGKGRLGSRSILDPNTFLRWNNCFGWY